MTLCEACSLKPVRKMKVPLNALFKSSVMCILRNKMSALVAVSNVWNYGRDK